MRPVTAVSDRLRYPFMTMTINRFEHNHQENHGNVQ